MKVSTILKIPLTQKNGNFPTACSRWSLRVKKINSYESEILSKCKINLDEKTFLNSFLVKIISFLALEEKLNENLENGSIKKLNITQMKENIKSDYNYFFDQYKLVFSYNHLNLDFYSFNDQFKESLLDSQMNFYNEVSFSSDLILTSYNSLHIFKDLIFNYITGETGINMVEYYKDVFKNHDLNLVNENFSKIKDLKFDEHTNITFFRNFSNKDFFNSSLDKINIVTIKEKEDIKNSLSKAKLSLKEEDNYFEIIDGNFSCKVIFATQENKKLTEGNHIVVSSNSAIFAEKILTLIGEISEFKYDFLYGNIIRNPLYSGFGYRICYTINGDKSLESYKTIGIKFNFNCVACQNEKGKFIFRSISSINKTPEKAIEELNALVNELK